jgi:alcohol dehydrogenase (cytochrome c)
MVSPTLSPAMCGASWINLKIARKSCWLTLFAVWNAGSYDPDLNLTYWGTAQAKPWVAASRGLSATDATLYANSTLALDPDTGKIIWYRQHVPGETLDLDEAFEQVLVDVNDEKALFTVGKHGILWKLGRVTGKFQGLKQQH